MGLASKLENDMDKWAANLSDFEMEGSKDVLRARTLLDDAKTIFSKVEKSLDLATDPRLDLADEVVSLKEALGQCKQRVAAQAKQLTDLTARAQDERQARKRAEARAKKAEESLESFLRRNPRTAYDAFSTDSHLKKHKPDL